MIFYSPSTGGFYDPDIHEDMPRDVVSITRARHQELLARQAMGEVIAPDADGQPITVPPQISKAEKLAQLRTRRDRLLRESDHTQLPDAPISSEERAAWAAYRQALRDLPELYAANPTSVVWPTPPNEESNNVD